MRLRLSFSYKIFCLFVIFRKNPIKLYSLQLLLFSDFHMQKTRHHEPDHIKRITIIPMFYLLENTKINQKTYNNKTCIW